MKIKNLLPKVSLAAFSFAVISCSSEQDFEPNLLPSNEIEIAGGTLNIPDFGFYERLIENQEEIQLGSFVSLASTINGETQLSSNSRLSDNGQNALLEFESTILLDILDEDGFVIIDNKLFFLDFNTELVAVTSDLELRQNLLEGNYENENILLFDFEDDVIGILEDGGESTVNPVEAKARIAASQIFDPNAPLLTDGCAWNKCDNSKYDSHKIYQVAGTNLRYRLEAKHVYQSAGIYFKLISEAKHMRSNDGILYQPENTSISIRYDYIYTSKKRSIGTRSETDEKIRWENDLEVRIYESSRGLESFIVESQFYVEIGGNHASPFIGWWLFELQRIRKS
ncbi:hypothetical protein [Algoriphagus namhaensis]